MVSFGLYYFLFVFFAHLKNNIIKLYFVLFSTESTDEIDDNINNYTSDQDVNECQKPGSDHLSSPDTESLIDEPVIAKRCRKCTLVDDYNTSNRQLDFNVGHNETNEIASSEDDISSCVVSEEGPPFGVDSPGCSTAPLHNNGVLTPGGETADVSNKRISEVIVSESSRYPSPIPQDNNQDRHDCVGTSVDPGSRGC